MGMYHIVVRGVDKLPVFNQTREKTRILNLIRENYEEYGIQIYAYCIMSNHFHLLVKAELPELASFMAKVLAAYANYYNYKHDRVGYVFQDRYKSQCVDSKSYYWNCLRYIHMNPVKANLSQNIMDYPYSSAREYKNLKKCGSGILDSASLELRKEQFREETEFWAFHKLTCREIFADISEEEFQQKRDIALEILVDMQYQFHVSSLEIFDYVKLREDFERKMKDTMNLSKREIHQIRDNLKMEFINV